MKSGPRKISLEDYKNALIKAKGHRALAAESLGVCHQAVSYIIGRYPELQELAEHLRERRTDYVELKLKQLIDEGNPTAIIFYLKTQGKHRGWVERYEATVANINIDGTPQKIKESMTPKDASKFYLDTIINGG